MSSFLLMDIILLFLATITAIAAVEIRNLLGAVLLFSIYSLLVALVWVNMDAVDVAFTEAAVGAGISAILLIGTLVLVGQQEIVRRAINWPALVAVIVTGLALGYGTLDMPAFGDPNSPAQNHPIHEGFTEQNVAKDPDGKSGREAAERAAAGEHDDGHEDYFHGHVPNQVTSVIVTYRAFDTMFEVCVIYAAGLGMILLLRGRRGHPLRGGLL